MPYKVINNFIDKEDNTLYRLGEEFPKGDSKSTKKRINELLKVHPKYKRAFIEKVEVEKTSSKE